MIEEQSDENEVETERLVVAEPGLSVFGPSSPSPRNSSETRVSQNGLPQVLFGSNKQKSKSRGRATTTPQTTTSSTTTEMLELIYLVIPLACIVIGIVLYCHVKKLILRICR